MAISKWSTSSAHLPLVFSSRDDSVNYAVLFIESTSTKQNEDLYLQSEYLILHQTLRLMLKMQGEEDFGVDYPTFEIASESADIFCAGGIPCPKVFSHGGDAIAFVWENEKVSKYVTVSIGEISYFQINRGDPKSTSGVKYFRKHELGTLIEILGGYKWISQQSTSAHSPISHYAPYFQYSISDQIHSENLVSNSYLALPRTPISELDAMKGQLLDASNSPSTTTFINTDVEPQIEAIYVKKKMESPWSPL